MDERASHKSQQTWYPPERPPAQDSFFGQGAACLTCSGCVASAPSVVGDNPRYVGDRQGCYVKETTYKYVGQGRGEFVFDQSTRYAKMPNWVLMTIGFFFIASCLYFFLANTTGTTTTSVQAAPTFNCLAGFANWEMGWSAKKQVFCCSAHGRGCTKQPRAHLGGLPPLAANTSAPQQSSPVGLPLGATTLAPVAAAPVTSPIAAAPGLPGRGKICGGEFDIGGVGRVSLVNAEYNRPGGVAGSAEAVDNSVICHMKGRSYFANVCAPGAYSNTEYSAMQLLGKTMRYTVDLSGAACGCNAALYLTSLHQNVDASSCNDFYCDAAKVCGVKCAEIDIQEANKHAWYSTFHTSDDPGGKGSGYGAAHLHWKPSEYGPGAQCIDTTKPFQTAVSFPIDSAGKLRAMEVTLTQDGTPCPLHLRVGEYLPFGRDGMAELTAALRAGMTPIISYWGVDDNVLFLDGKAGGQGPCAVDHATTCAESVQFSDFSVA